MGVWGWSPQWGPGAEPLSPQWGLGAEPLVGVSEGAKPP